MQQRCMLYSKKMNPPIFSRAFGRLSIGYPLSIPSFANRLLKNLEIDVKLC